MSKPIASISSLLKTINIAKQNNLKVLELTRDTIDKQKIELYDIALANLNTLDSMNYNVLYIPPSGMNGHCHEITIKWD